MAAPRSVHLSERSIRDVLAALRRVGEALDEADARLNPSRAEEPTAPAVRTLHRLP